MGLATQFDLDLFMTGYDLWATHAGRARRAHYDLAHSPAEHTVSAAAAGLGRHRASIADHDGDLGAALGSPETRRARAEDRVAGDDRRDAETDDLRGDGLDPAARRAAARSLERTGGALDGRSGSPRPPRPNAAP